MLLITYFFLTWSLHEIAFIFARLCGVGQAYLARADSSVMKTNGLSTWRQMLLQPQIMWVKRLLVSAPKYQPSSIQLVSDPFAAGSSTPVSAGIVPSPELILLKPPLVAKAISWLLFLIKCLFYRQDWGTPTVWLWSCGRGTAWRSSGVLMVAAFWSDQLKHIALLLASLLSCCITLSITLWHLCFFVFLK